MKVIQFSIDSLVSGFGGSLPFLKVDALIYGLIGFGIALKAALYVFCEWSLTIVKSDG